MLSHPSPSSAAFVTSLATTSESLACISKRSRRRRVESTTLIAAEGRAQTGTRLGTRDTTV
eukprot:9488583-Karenia_brevis.AAC.1